MCCWDWLFCQYTAPSVFTVRTGLVPCGHSSLSSNSCTGPVSGKHSASPLPPANIITLQLSLKAFWERVSSGGPTGSQKVLQGLALG